jgi:hypothetical protein
MTSARLSFVLTTIASLVVTSAAAARETTLDRVRDLYRSAAYEEALAALDEVTNDAATANLVEAHEYRLLCLIALDRRAEVRDAIASLVTADPSYQLSQGSPRVRTLFKEVRQSLLPTLVQHAYADARVAFERHDPESVARFARVLALLDDPDLVGTPVSDLRTVAAGFRDLSKALGPASEAPATNSQAAEAARSQTAKPGSPMYRELAADVVLPEALSQPLPRWVLPPALPGQEPREWQGTLEIVIDQKGDVVSATLQRSFHPTYDEQLIKAALSWKYKPASRNGVPVRFLKLVYVHLNEAR